jgi:uncharacterized protein YjbI with pentapeptide repeats
MAANLDPYDVEALERALNDSAVRVSAIWVSFLLFGLYLIIAVGSVTQLQLFLNGPIKLPVLDVNLPVWGFFLLAPVLFVVFHCYLLIQVLLLRRTAEAYNEAVEHSILISSDGARIRQRLANTLFAQIFAGSPDEREGPLGALLRFTARVTLAIGPVLVLLMFQGWFLRYQDGLVTFTHRILIVVDLTMVLVLWRALLKPQDAIRWRLPIRRDAWFGFAIATVLFSWLFLHYPGEPLTQWVRFGGKEGCRWVVGFADRFYLPWVDLVDDEKLAKIESLAEAEGLSSYQGERTHDLSGRRLRCGNFEHADFRRVNFSHADLRGANLADAKLQGAVLTSAILQGADLERVQMQGAELSSWREREGYNPSERAIGYRFGAGANLEGAWLLNAQLQGARLGVANLRGAILQRAQLQGASLSDAWLEAANLREAKLQGANLRGAWLQGTDLGRAQLQGANLAGAHMERARFHEATLTLAHVRRGYVWGAAGAKCDDAQVMEPQLALTVEGSKSEEDSSATTDQQELVTRLERHLRKAAEPNEAAQPVAGPEHDSAIEDIWRACERKALTHVDYEMKHAEHLVQLVCDATESEKELVNGIYSNWIEESDDPRNVFSYAPLSDDHRRAVAHGLLKRDVKECSGARALSDRAKKRLQNLTR